MLNEEQAASLLGVPVDYLRQMRADRTGPPYYEGLLRRIGYKQDELVAWAEKAQETMWRRVEPSNTSGGSNVGLPTPEQRPTQPQAPPPSQGVPSDVFAMSPEPTAPAAKPAGAVIATVRPPASDDWRPTGPVGSETEGEIEAVRALERPDEGIMKDLAAQGRLKYNEDGSVEILPPRGNSWDCPNMEGDAAQTLVAEKGVKLGGQGLDMGRWADDVAVTPESVAADVLAAQQTGTPRVKPDGQRSEGMVFSQMANKGPDENKSVIKVVSR